MSLSYYVGLLADRPRIDGFRAGLEAEVRDGETVLEIGTGMGTYAMFAARAGAGHVWGVESQPVVHLADAIARSNGLSDRITFVRGRLPDVELPGPVDLIVFEDFPVRLLHETSWRLLRDVVAAHLRPGGRIFPAHARLNLALVGGSDVDTVVGLGDQERLSAYDIDWTPVSPYLANAPRFVGLSPEVLIEGACRSVDVRLHPLPDVSKLAVAGSWTLPKRATVGGLLLWFDLDLGAGGWYGNGPGGSGGVWGQTLLPVVPRLEVAEGEHIEARVAPESLPDGAPGWLAWSVRSGSEARSGHEFAAEPASLRDLYGDTLQGGRSDSRPPGSVGGRP